MRFRTAQYCSRFSAVCALAQSLDLSSVDKLAAKAKEVNRVTLTHDQLQMFMRMGGDNDKSDKKKLMSSLDSVQVRNFTFEQAGQYSDADLDAVRSQVERMRGCTAIVDSKEKNEHSQVFLCSENGKASGIAVISGEPKEVTVVFVKGTLNLSDLGKLDGVMGMPKMELAPEPPAPPKRDD